MTVEDQLRFLAVHIRQVERDLRANAGMREAMEEKLTELLKERQQLEKLVRACEIL